MPEGVNFSSLHLVEVNIGDTSDECCECTFSTLRRVKSYLRSTMSQSRLNHLVLLKVHSQLTDQLDLIDVANSFVAGSEHRLSLFGKFN